MTTLIRTRTFSAAVLVAAIGSLPWVATLIAGPPSRMVLRENFDSEPVGAVPENLGHSGVPVISPQVGQLFGEKHSSLAKINVATPAEGAGNVLRLCDAAIPEGGGHSELIATPEGGAGPGLVTIEFSLTPVILVDERFEVAIVDNRTTPGTGLLAAVKVAPDGGLTVGGLATGLKLSAGEKYSFSVLLALTQHGADSWLLRARKGDGSGAAATWGPFPTESDGTEVTSLTFSTGNGGQGAFDLDDLTIFVQDP